MSRTSPPLPGWLKTALSDHDYLQGVIDVLANREMKRERARTATRHDHSKARSRLRGVIPSALSQPPSDLTAHFSVEVGSRPENRHENRYLGIEPHDRTRVLVGPPGETERPGRYFNGNWVRELHGGRWWIATQAPLPSTAHVYLSLMMQPETRPPPSLAPPHPSFPPGPCRIRTSVQLTLAHEGGRPKAHAYFPSEVGESFVVPAPNNSTAPSLKITLEAQRTIDEASCVQSTLRLVQCADPKGEPDMKGWSRVEELGAPVHFTHLLFRDWPDFGVPEGPEEKARLLTFARLVAQINREPPTPIPANESLHPDPPIIVNCSAGIGRTGSFIAICSLLRAHGMLLPVYPLSKPSDFPQHPPSPLGPLPDEVQNDEVAAEVDSLREQRCSMVQRPEQQLLVYELLAAAYHEGHSRANLG